MQSANQNFAIDVLLKLYEMFPHSWSFSVWADWKQLQRPESACYGPVTRITETEADLESFCG